MRLPQIFFAGGSNLMYVFFPPLLQFRKSKGPGHMPVRSRQLFVDLILYINVFVYCKYNKEQSILKGTVSAKSIENPRFPKCHALFSA